MGTQVLDLGYLSKVRDEFLLDGPKSVIARSPTIEPTMEM
jgi:hypothetical protein